MPLVVEVSADSAVDDGLLRHAARLLRARPDLRVDDVLDPPDRGRAARFGPGADASSEGLPASRSGSYAPSMSHRRSNRGWQEWRRDADVLANELDIALIRAVAAGRVIRGGDAPRSISAPHLLDDRPVRMELRRLAREDLVFVPISAPPVIAPRGRRLLEIANGEVAATPE